MMTVVRRGLTPLRLAAGLLGAAFLAFAIWLANLVWFKPFNIDHFYERVFVEYAFSDPELLSQLRIIPAALEWYEDDLSDASLARDEHLMDRTEQNLALLRSYDREDQTPSQLLSTDILDWFLDQQVRGREFMYHNYPLNQFFGIQSSQAEFMIETHQINSLDDAEDYISRLSQFDRKFSQVMEGLELRERRGIIPPRFVVERVLAEMKAFTGKPARENPLFTSFAERAAKVEEITPQELAALEAEVERVISESVYPAYRRFINYYESLLPKTTTDDGVWKLPDGDRFYALQLRGFTTTDYTPEEIHRLGLEQVEKITAEMRTILDSQGHLGGTVAEWMARLASDPRFLYEDSDTGRAQILADYQKIIDEIDGGLEPYFNIRPKAGIEVKRIPEFKEKTAPGAYYQDPPRDGSRPGVFYVNLRNVAEIPRFGMRTLAYHEAIPGHHFQIALAAELEGLPQFRTFGLFTAYVEGWALYAEQLAAELGFQNDPYDRLGYLQAALFRAVRLVVDTGIHHKRWTREQAIKYMRDTTGMAESDVVAEIERYIVMPGQACAYMVGKLKLLELREKARAALGEDFDIREFHDVILKNGAVPLSILERIVDEWIATKLG